MKFIWNSILRVWRWVKDNKLLILTVIVPIIIGVIGLLFGDDIIGRLSSSENSPNQNCFIENCDEINKSFESFKYNKGYIPDNNYQKTITETLTFTKATSSETRDSIARIREKTFNEAISWFEKTHNYGIRDFIKNAYPSNKYEEVLNDIRDEKTDLINAFKIYSINENVNCNTCIYNFEIIFFSPINSANIIPQDIRNTLSKYTQMTPAYKKLKHVDFSGPVDTKIDLVEILLSLISDKNFENELKGELKLHQEYIKYLDEESRSFFHELENDSTWNITNFRSGEYRLSAIMASLLEEISKIIITGVEKYPLKKWDITTIGYADQTQIKDPIVYTDLGKWSVDAELISLADSIYGNNIKPNITGNGELSYARAYSGLDFLVKCIPQNVKNRISFTYKGKGEDLGAKDKWEKRRIEIHIQSH